MGITDVLTLINTEGIANQQGMNANGTPVQGESLLFSILLNYFAGIQSEATEQGLEEQMDENVTPEKDKNTTLEKDENITQSILGQNSYLQILQNVFPAGKEANSGLEAGQSLNSNFFSKQQGVKVQDIAMYLEDFEFEGIANPKSRENTSLDSMELDKHIKIIEQLKELSGKVELSAPQKDETIDAPFRQAYSVLNHQLDNDMDGDAKDGENMVSQAKSLPIAAPAESKEQQGLSHGQDHLGKSSNEQQANIQSISSMIQKTDEAFSMANSLNTEEQVPLEKGKVWEQVLDILKSQDLSSTQKEIKELSIHLQPAELGKVQVSLRLENGQVHLLMNASEQATGTILQNSMQELKNGLLQMGVACGNFEMGSQQHSEAGSGREYAQNSRSSGYEVQRDEVPMATGAASYFANNGSGNRINLSA